MIKENRFENNFKKILLMILMLIFILAISPIELQNDTFFDIALGQRYTQEGIFEIDNFSIHENLNYYSHHFIVNLLIYYVYNFFGFFGLYIVEILLASIIAFLFYNLNKCFTKNKKIAYIYTFVEMIMFSTFISLRSQMFSSIIFLLEIILINKFLYNKLSKTKKNIILIILTLLPILLLNVHGGVIYFYYIILFVYLLNFIKIKILKLKSDENIDTTNLKKLIIPFLVSIPLLIINPFGINALNYMFKTLSNSFINQNIQEFQPFTLKTALGIYIAVYISFHILTLCISDKTKKNHEIMFLIGTIFMTFISIRHFIFYVITTVVLLPHIENVLEKIKIWLYNGLTVKGAKMMTITINFVIVIILIYISVSNFAYRKNEYVPKSVYPVDAVKYIKENISNEYNIFNEYSWGSYLILNDIRVFIDSRCDLYTKEYNKNITVAEDYIKSLKCKINYEEIVEKYNIKYFLLTKNEPLSIMLLKDENYIKSYEDDTAYVFQKK